MEMMASHGPALLDPTSSVSADLLQEWLNDRNEIRQGVKVAACKIAAVTCAGAILLFQLSGTANQAKAGLNVANAELSKINASIKDAGGDVSAQNLVPDVTELAGKSRKQNASFLNGLISSFNQSLPDMALANCKADLTAGEFHFTGQGDATTFTAANGYIERLTALKNSTGAIMKSTSPSEVFGPASVSFQFTNTLKVAQ